MINRKAVINVLGLLIFLLLPPLTQLFGQEYLLSLFSRILIYGLAAASLDLILGYGGMVSLGHAVFMGIGGYSVGILAFHSYESTAFMSWPLLISGTENALLVWPVAVLAAAFFGLVTGAICLRTKGMHFIMITLAFAQMAYYFFVSLSTYGGSDGLSLYNRNTMPLFDLGSDVTFYYLCLGILLVFLLMGHRLMQSHFGRVISGCRENEQRVQVLGFASYRYKLACYTFAAAAAGLAGALLANQGEFVSPGLMHWTKSGEIMVMVLLGGMGTLTGPVLGAATLLLMEDFLAMYTEHWMVILGPFLIVVVLFAKRGLYGLLTGAGGRHD
ncbi:MAG TPA: branched-chain amino acid ABC transporter permease [Desulfocapsa sulfexigens]|nr:branched-chain amino acid ABC transporter permease [Desulfocapsa sulfexigens]